MIETNQGRHKGEYQVSLLSPRKAMVAGTILTVMHGKWIIGDVANSICPLLIIGKVQLRLRAPVHYHSFLPAEVSKSFLRVKI